MAKAERRFRPGAGQTLSVHVRLLSSTLSRLRVTGCPGASCGADGAALGGDLCALADFLMP